MELQSFEAFTPAPDYRSIPGWSNFESVYQMAAEAVPDNAVLVEIGSWMGRSAAMMCTFLERAGKAGGARFYCVDTWKGSKGGVDEMFHNQTLAQLGGNMLETFQKNMTPWKDGYIPLQMDSVEAAKQFADASVDFVFIDGGHTKEQVLADISAWRPKVKPGGILAGHDADWPEVLAAVLSSVIPIEIWDTASWVYRVP